MKKIYKVYLAGPDVFWENAQQVLADKVVVCERFGLLGMPPVDNSIVPHPASDYEKAVAIYQGNLAIMKECNAIIANITPFRGPHMDPGTAFEIGYFAALGKPVVCYTQDEQELVDRVIDWSAGNATHQGETVRDCNGDLIEDFGLHENLMIEASVGPPISQPPSTVEIGQVFACANGFAHAARSLAHYVGGVI